MAYGLTGRNGTAVSPLYTDTATQVHPLGTLGFANDGRVFKWAQAVATTVAGTVQQSTAPLANHLAATAPAVAIGATSFAFTPGNTAGAANLYAEGYLQVDTTPGNGYTYSVSGHAAITASTAFTLYLNEPIQIALTSASRLGLLHNPCKNVIICPTTQTATAVGVCTYIITATQYGWIQSNGAASVLINGTPTITAPVVPSGTTAGAVDLWTTAAAAVTVQPIGHAMQVGVSTKNNMIYLQMGV
jgi:hypothetical protein